MFRLNCFSSADEIPVADWERFVSHEAVGLEINHLRAIEVSGINAIRPYYLIGYWNDEPVGIAYCFSTRVDLAKMANQYPPEVLASVKTWMPDFMDLRVLEVGHIASLGKTIEVLQPFQTRFLQAFSGKIDGIARMENADLCIVRDISPEWYEPFCVLKDHGFCPAMGYPIARMQLGWDSFDAYLAALKAKTRKNILLKRAKMKAPELSVEIIEDYAPYAERLAELWTNVAKRINGYEHERLTPAYFEAMSRYLRGRSHVIAIKRFGEIVAFSLGLIGDEEYFGVAEGLDYDLRDQYDLYANNIFESLRMACELKKKTFNIGITTYDFKMAIGARPEPCHYFLKAVKQPRYSPVYADFIQKSIPQPENRHRPFRDDLSILHPHSESKINIPASQDDPLDPFAKHYRYLRADAARSAGLYPYFPVFESAQEPVIRHENRDVIMLGTNSYLGLATHPKVKEAAKAAIEKYGSGCSGSPLLNGTLDIHKRLAGELARFMSKEDALVFSTGYQTNVGVVSALVGRDDVLVMDERNHASLIDGARLSGATVVRYLHNDARSLEGILKAYAARPKLVVTDSLFSMEGTIVDLPEIIRLVRKYKARLMLDESHAIGALGPGGRGVAEQYGLLDKVDLVMGTFSKSFASVGGFVAGDRKLIDTLRHTARSHIFSASLPPASAAAVLAALGIVGEEPERRARLLENARYLAAGLRALGYEIQYHDSAIISVFCGHELLALAAFRKLLDEGVYVNPVTYPAVPKNGEMLRVSLMATHDEATLRKALEVFERIRTKNWPSGSTVKKRKKHVPGALVF